MRELSWVKIVTHTEDDFDLWYYTGWVFYRFTFNLKHLPYIYDVESVSISYIHTNKTKQKKTIWSPKWPELPTQSNQLSHSPRAKCPPLFRKSILKCFLLTDGDTCMAENITLLCRGDKTSTVNHIKAFISVSDTTVHIM